MSDVKEVIKQKLVEQMQQLVARGGPDVLTVPGRYRLHYEPVESRIYQDSVVRLRKSETYYPLAAVIAALDIDLYLLQQDWNEALNQRGPLPLYLHPIAAGHYSAYIAETIVLEHLIWLTDACNEGMEAD
jgi:hypothetical protein